MNYDSLSSQELQTLASYEEIAAERAKHRSNAMWWNTAYHYLTTFVPTGYILDIGCAHGRDALLFKQVNTHRYVGIDISPAMLTLACLHAPQSVFIRMNMHAMAFKSASFDGFWAAASLLHIPKYAVPSVLGEIRRVMKTGAIGFIALKEGEGEEMVIGSLRGDNRFYAFYHLEEFERILIENGFEVIMTHRDLREYDRHHANLHMEPNAWLTFFARVL